ncbi:hypothetical protein HDV04_004832 [Boothiomyces sp. JEL0838]|nr:hypothetical protein HDV04_004832 [Boothiomyces sp. JEL0838]
MSNNELGNMNIKQYIFGYGSLINTASRKRSLQRNTSVIPVKVNGFERRWGYRCPRKNYTAVLVTRKQNHTVNGVLIPIADPENDLKILDQREANYARCLINISDVMPLIDAEIPKDALIWVYETHNSNFKNYSTTSQQCHQIEHIPTPNCPIPQSYIDCILAGCLSIGKEFAEEFVLSTRGWNSECWWNDREACITIKKYNSQHDPSDTPLNCKDIDEILSNLLPLKN